MDINFDIGYNNDNFYGFSHKIQVIDSQQLVIGVQILDHTRFTSRTTMTNSHRQKFYFHLRKSYRTART